MIQWYQSLMQMDSMTISQKAELHPRNKHNSRYDLKALAQSCPELVPYVLLNKYNNESIDFKNPEAVKILNKALLKHCYGISNWDIPKHYLCPPIPGRADYIHYMADLLGSVNEGTIPTGRQVKGLDIGVGANCVYPLIGHAEYQWSFIGSDIDEGAVGSAVKILTHNPLFSASIEIRIQPDRTNILKNILNPEEQIDFTICNPPFHSSQEQAAEGTKRKWNNLGVKPGSNPILNFGGQKAELWCEGGEKAFVGKLIEESFTYSHSCLWFSSLVSKEENLPAIFAILKKFKVLEVRVIDMNQGQKKSRFVAWTFLSKSEQKKWAKIRWN